MNDCRDEKYCEEQRKKWAKIRKSIFGNRRGFCIFSLFIFLIIIGVISCARKTIEKKESNSVKEAVVVEEVVEVTEINEAEPYTIEDFEIIYQEPELPTGCEVTALTMVLQFYGYSVDKTTVAWEYLPITTYDIYTGSDGRTYGPDLYNYFIGDPFTEYGMVCGPGAIVTAANDYLKDIGSSMSALDITGCSVDELYERVSQGQPVVVWGTIGMEDRYNTSGWYTEDGTYVEWSQNDHGSVLVGWDETSVTIACPILGTETYDREQFEEIFEERGNKAVVLE